jgi:hypothetical protein
MKATFELSTKPLQGPGNYPNLDATVRVSAEKIRKKPPNGTEKFGTYVSFVDAMNRHWHENGDKRDNYGNHRHLRSHQTPLKNRKGSNLKETN